MKVSRAWLQTFFETPLPDAGELERVLTFGAFEVEGVEENGEDSILDVKVLPNRAHDCLCHRGIAKELSVLLGLSLSRDPLTEEVPAFDSFGDVSVSVENTSACPAYHAARVSGVRVGPSPVWLVKRLASIGQRSINNVVDATNLVMNELGQPLHAFDASKLGGADGKKMIAVRMARPGESITILGGDSYTLADTVQLITDAATDTPIAMAGIKGGSVAEVDENTTDIILESAKFHPTLTRKASQLLKLRTDASYRFENEIPDELPAYALSELITLIKDIAGGELSGYAGVVRPRASLPYKIGISSREANKLLGTDLSDSDMEKILTRYGFAYEMIEDPRVRIVGRAKSVIGAPYKRLARIRFDTPKSFNCSSLSAWCAIEAGCSFGVARIAIDQFAYLDPVDEKKLAPGDLVFTNTGEVRTMGGEMYSNVLDTMVQDEAIRTKTLEFLPGTDIGHGVDHVGIYTGDGKVIHTSSKTGTVAEEVLSESPTFAHEKWYRRIVTEDEVRFSVTVPFSRLDMRLPADLIEEIGRAYGYENIAARELPAPTTSPEQNNLWCASETVRRALAGLGFIEVYSYTLRENGAVKLVNALAEDKAFIRSSLVPGVVEALEKGEYHAPFLGLTEVLVFEIGNVFDEKNEHLHVCIGARPLASAKRSEKANAKLLEAKETLEKALGVHLDEQVGEETLAFNLSSAIEGKTYACPEFSPVVESAAYIPPSSYPFMLRDIAVWVPDGEGSGDDIVSVVREHAGNLFARADVFDTFSKEGKTSYAYHLVFQSHEKTLTDAEVNEIMQKVTDSLNGRTGWQVR
ncbi:MAG: hypothetical protein AMXMBFR44_5690 [Candidatus Campbellbacteria bacterium]